VDGTRSCRVGGLQGTAEGGSSWSAIVNKQMVGRL